jgi:hypothetical protein
MLAGLLLAGVALAGMCGCTHVQLAPNVQGEYKFGELQVFADRDFAHTYDAAKAGLKDLGLFQTQDERKVVEAELHARDAADTLVVVKIKEVAKNRTSLKIRYGINPDLPSAQKVYDAIQKHL